ncbi:MAG: SLC13 family permease [Thermoplasmatota archaeon]
MEWTHAVAALVFAATFLLLALGRVGRRPVPRGLSALAGGVLTYLVLVPSGGMAWRVWRLIDWQVILLLAGLMVLAGLAEAAGLFAGVRRRLTHLAPGLALWACLLLVAATSALLLNDAAIVVLVPFLLPALRAAGLPPVPSVVLMAVAANAGSLLTPFGNPQNAALAAHAGLGVVDFLRAQGLIVLLAVAVLGLAAWKVGRLARPAATEVPAHAVARGRPWLALCIAVFLTGAAGGARFGLGTAAVLAAALAYAGLRPLLGRDADRAAWRSLDWNVLALFLGLYLLPAGLAACFPSQNLPLARLDTAWKAATATTLLSNTVGNVPAMLAFIGLDPAWAAAHASFLVTVSTLGGALFLTGSAASLLAADQARRQGVEVRFWPFLKEAVPWTLPLLGVGAWLTW